MKNIYQLNDQLKQLYKEAAFFEPVIDSKSGNVVWYEAIFRTGQFDGIYDYDAGILMVVIYPHGVSISTVDDGVWFAESQDGNTNIFFQQLLDLFDSFNGVLPTEWELNNMLTPIGLYGCFTG